MFGALNAGAVSRIACPAAPTAPGSSSTTWKARHADDGVAERLAGDGRVRRAEVAQAQQLVQPDEHRRVQDRRAEEHDKRGSGWATMNWVPMMPARNPTIVFASPPMPMTAARQASCTSPANVPVSSPVTGPDVSAT